MIIIESEHGVIVPSDGCGCGGQWLAYIREWNPDTGLPTNYQFDCTRFDCDRSPSHDACNEMGLWIIGNIRIARYPAVVEQELLWRWVEGKGLPGEAVFSGA